MVSKYYGLLKATHPPLNLPLEGGEVKFSPPFQGEGRGGDGLSAKP